MPNRYRLKGASLDEIRLKAQLQHGPKARIISADRVISPGIAGLFAGDHYEAVIEVPAESEVTGTNVFTAELVPDAIPPGRSGGRGPLRAVFGGSTAAPAPAAPAPTQASPATPAAPAPAPVRAEGPEAGFMDVPAARSHQFESTAIAALLEEADAAEMTLHRQGTPGVSTESPDFAEVLAQLGAGLRVPDRLPPRQAPPAVPVVPAPGSAAADNFGAGVTEDILVLPGTVAPSPSPRFHGAYRAPEPLSGIGDLVVLVGLGEDALDTALAMSTAAGGADVRTGGQLSAYGHLHVDGRQSATAARAQAVLMDRTVLVAFGVGRSGDAAARIHPIAALAADQVWVVVDAGRKPEDTERWVNVLSAQLHIDAVAVIGATETDTPETVNALELPVGWIDARQARVAHL
ncbi:hypothetical protein [Arthrobacter sp. EM1]|uniref:hypothetical protein n=3 Tax=Arthrobacter TaxID=1663 RepID=UPI00249E5967|nr:hypothetical protein [Arthrobacter sp. EM1]WGZ79962.1 hypothetical protein QI450_01545 [Arthrobacter sp. EM1]